MRRKKLNPNLKITFTSLTCTGILFAGLLFVFCNLYDDSPTSPPNILKAKDSLAVRSILDANGLTAMKVREVIYLENSMVKQINLDSILLRKFVFCKYFDSLIARPGLNLINNDIDTLLFPDIIFKTIGINLDHNKLKEIPGDIDHLKGNIALYINFNQIASISPNIMKCQISYINVNFNNLCNIPDSISQWIINHCRDSVWRSTQKCN